MEQNTLGIVLSYYRTKYQFSQNQICQGICSSATLSRIEKGSKEIDSLMSESLLGRLGREVTRFEIILNDADYHLWKMRADIEKYMEKENYKEAKEGVRKYQEMTAGNHHLHKQFCLFQEAKIKLAEHQENGEICRILIKALHLTKPCFKLDSSNEYLYDPMEIELIVLLIHLQYHNWTQKEKERELLKIFEYVTNIYSERKKEEIGINILMELLRMEQSFQNDLKVIKYADKAIDFISEGRGIRYIPELHFIKAKAMERYAKEKGNWEREKKYCMEECLMSYYVFDIMGRKNEKDKVGRFCEERLGWQITEQGMLYG